MTIRLELQCRRFIYIIYMITYALTFHYLKLQSSLFVNAVIMHIHIKLQALWHRYESSYITTIYLA